MTHTYVRIKNVRVTRMFNITLSQLARSRLVLYDRATTPRTRKQLFDSEMSYATKILTIRLLSQILFASLVVVTFSDSVKNTFFMTRTWSKYFYEKKKQSYILKGEIITFQVASSAYRKYYSACKKYNRLLRQQWKLEPRLKLTYL